LYRGIGPLKYLHQSDAADTRHRIFARNRTQSLRRALQLAVVLIGASDLPRRSLETSQVSCGRFQGDQRIVTGRTKIGRWHQQLLFKSTCEAFAV
jgi:hypothetical protein